MAVTERFKLAVKENRPPTTFEMDGLLTQEDIDNRHYVMKTCLGCAKWSKQDSRNKRSTPCEHCRFEHFDNQSNHWYSLRTFVRDKKVSKKDLDAQRGKKMV